MKAINNDLEDRKQATKIEKKEEKLNKVKQLKTVLLFEMDNLMNFNRTISHNLLLEKDYERVLFLKRLILYDRNNPKDNLTLKEMEKLKTLILYYDINENDKIEDIKIKFNKGQRENNDIFNIKISDEKAELIVDFLKNFKYLNKQCLEVNVRDIKQLEEFNEKIQDFSSLLFILSRDEINVLYGIKQLIKSVIEEIQISKKGDRKVGIYKIDRNFFLLNILINELNYMAQTETKDL